MDPNSSDDVHMPIVESLARLIAAIERAGAPAPAPPVELAAIKEIEREIAPLTLPVELVAFWTAIDSRTLAVEVDEGFCGPGFALRSWQSDRAESVGFVPSTLLQVGYTSHCCLSIELDDPSGEPGGALFSWSVDGMPFRLCYPSLTAYLDRITSYIEHGWLVLGDLGGGPALWPLECVDDARESPALHPIPEDVPDHPVHGTNVEYEQEALTWPAHWQRASGIDVDDAVPQGATMTVAEVLASDPGVPLTCTIRGEVVSGVMADVSVIRVDDGTGRLIVECPPESTPFGLRVGDWWEFALELAPGPRGIAPPPTLDEIAGDPVVAAVAQGLLKNFGGEAAAVAVMVRPLRS